MTDARPDPDLLLADLASETRGRLKIFLGAAPGVGKTCEMLRQARRRRESGEDVLGGVIETHGRAETEAEIGDLPILSPLAVPYRGRALPELDLDAALARRPALLLVDELAHTNTPGLRHAKRWEDVVEVLAAGISVWTTLNVQHLESLNDDIVRITGVRVAETLPDRVLAMADDIELVDLPPAELRARLREGRVYRADIANRALDGFFREGNLAGLREVALRTAASRVDRDVQDWMRRSLTAGPFPATERVLALVGPGDGGAAVVRAAKRLADALRAPWIALHVERPVAARDAPLPARGALSLAAKLDAEIVTVAASGPLVPTVLAEARARNATQIVLGRTTRRRGRAPWRRTLATALVRGAPEFGIHVVPRAVGPLASTPPARRRGTARELPAWIAPLAAVALLTALGVSLRGLVPNEAADMVYLVPVIAAALAGGTLPALLTAAAAVLTWDFFFVPPFYTVTIDRSRDVVTGIVFAAVAVLTGSLAGRVRAEATTASARIEGLRRIGAFIRRFGASTGEVDLLRAVAAEAATLNGRAVVLIPDRAGALALEAASPDGTTLDAGAVAASNWAWSHGEATGRGTATLPATAWRFLPFGAGGERRGIIGVATAADTSHADPPDGPKLQVLEALADQAGAALERVRLMARAARTEALEEAERLRTALLASLGHDLRTPLAGIQGAAGTLRALWTELTSDARDDLLATLEEDVARMARFISNIAELTRIEGGQVMPHLAPVAVGPVIEAAIALMPGAPLVSAGRDGLDLRVLADAALLEQALFNLLDNARRYSPENAPISVGARREGAFVAIAVADNGIGVSPADLPRLFESWFRASRTDRVAPGTGLGLAISRGLVRAQGGTIEARSPNPDAPADGLPGTVVTIRLPFAPASGAASSR